MPNSMTDRRRRQKEQRAARREAEKKVAGRKELMRRLGFAFGLGGLVALIFILFGLAGRSSDTLPGTYEGYRAQPTACDADQPPPERVMSFDGFERQDDIDAAETVTAVITTSCGEVVIELDPAGYPETVHSFVFLAREGFYDGTVFHRIVEDFVIQGGDPDAIGTGGPGYRIADEFPDEEFIYEEGVVAMANAGRRTTGSQFFIVVGDNARVLRPQFNILGRVVSGFETLSRITEVRTMARPGTRETSVPLETVYVERIEIVVEG